MKRIFQCGPLFPIADGTSVSPVFNPWDINEGSLPLEAFEGASIAVGEIAAGGTSRPHLHPVVSQVTWLLEGALLVRMKNANTAEPYELVLEPGQAVLTEPMALLQLCNRSNARIARVMYAVTPAYVHVPGVDGYDDALVLDQSWESLARLGFQLPDIDLGTVRSRREAAQASLRLYKTGKQ